MKQQNLTAPKMRKLIELDDETHQALVQLGLDRMGSLQDLADEAFADLLVKHGVPRYLKDALRKSVVKTNGKAVKSSPNSTSKTRRAG